MESMLNVLVYFKAPVAENAPAGPLLLNLKQMFVY